MASSSHSQTLNLGENRPTAPEISGGPAEVGDLIVRYLEQMGVEYVFGVPGGAIEPLYNALARSERRGGPRAMVARHESGAAFMADGYARETGKVGVCCATTGPGVTNMMTGVASAYQDNTPLLVITAQTPLNTFGRGATQESSCTAINTVDMLRHCTKYSSLVSHIEQIEWKLASALIAAHQQPMGPAHLSIPLDLLRSPISHFQPRYNLKELIRPAALFDHDSTKRLCEYMMQSRKSVFVIGERCTHASSTILDLALLLNADVIATPQGKGLVSPYHPRYRGIFGIAGHKGATSTLSDPRVDLVIVIGTNLDEMTTNGWDEATLMTEKLVHVDSSSHFFSRSPIAQYHVCGDLTLVFEHAYNHFSNLNIQSTGIQQSESTGNASDDDHVVRFDRRLTDRRSLRESSSANSPSHIVYPIDRRSGDRRRRPSDFNVLRHFRFDEEQKCYDNSSPVKPQRLMFDLSRLFPSNTRFVAEMGNSFLWAIHYLQPLNRRISGKREKNRSLFFMGMGFSSMGWGIGASVGVALGTKNTPIVCITGDGSFLMSGQEITVAAQHKLPIIYILLNDASLGMVRHGQKLGGAEPIAHELPRISYADMATAMGINAYTIRSPDDMATLNIEDICTYPGPSLLDVYVDRDETPPLSERLKMLATSR